MFFSRKVFLIGILLAVSMLACSVGSKAKAPVVTPTPTLEPVAVSQAAADRFKAEIRQQILDSDSTEFSLTITDEEATSFLALYGTELPMSNPQIHFGEDKVYLFGEANVGISAPLVLVAAVTLRDGQVTVQVEEAHIGRFDMPTSLRQQISTTINESIGDAANTVRITYVQVSPGQITLRGTKENTGD